MPPVAPKVAAVPNSWSCILRPWCKGRSHLSTLPFLSQPQPSLTHDCHGCLLQAGTVPTSGSRTADPNKQHQHHAGTCERRSLGPPKTSYWRLRTGQQSEQGLRVRLVQLQPENHWWRQ